MAYALTRTRMTRTMRYVLHGSASCTLLSRLPPRPLPIRLPRPELGQGSTGLQLRAVRGPRSPPAHCMWITISHWPFERRTRVNPGGGPTYCLPQGVQLQVQGSSRPLLRCIVSAFMHYGATTTWPGGCGGAHTDTRRDVRLRNAIFFFAWPAGAACDVIRYPSITTLLGLRPPSPATTRPSPQSVPSLQRAPANPHCSCSPFPRNARRLPRPRNGCPRRFADGSTAQAGARRSCRDHCAR